MSILRRGQVRRTERGYASPATATSRTPPGSPGWERASNYTSRAYPEGGATGADRAQVRGGVLQPRAYGALDEPRAIQLRFNPEARIIGLRATSPDHPSAHTVRQQKRTRSFLVAAKGFLRRYGIPFDVSQRYRGALRGNMLVFDLTQPPIGMGRTAAAKSMETSNGQAPSRPGRSLKTSAPTRPPS